jgi:DNA-binding NtrC family response regulator
VRELENIIEQAFVLCCGSIIELHHLPLELQPHPANGLGPGSMNLHAMEKHFIAESLRRCKGNRKKAAQELGIDVATLYRKIKLHGIEAPERDGRGRRH